MKSAKRKEETVKAILTRNSVQLVVIVAVAALLAALVGFIHFH